MIVRSWRARATADNAPAYIVHAQTRVLPQLAAIAGYRGAWVLTDDSREPVEIVVLTCWDSMEAIRAFAGADPSVAVVEPDAHAVLIDCDETVQHHVVAAWHGMPPS